MNESTPIPPGGDETALDMSSERDRGLLRQAMKSWPRRWRAVTHEKKDGWVAGLCEANDLARAQLKSQDCKAALDAAKAIASIVKTGVAMEGQMQSDEHLADKNGRLADGLPTEIIETKPIEIRIVGMSAPPAPVESDAPANPDQSAHD